MQLGRQRKHVSPGAVITEIFEPIFHANMHEKTAIRRVAVRETGIYRRHRAPIDDLLETPPTIHHSTIVLRGLRGSLNAEWRYFLEQRI